MDIRATFTRPPKRAHWAYQYGMLLFSLGLLIWYVWWYLSYSSYYPGDPYIGGVVILTLLFGHLAFWFSWPVHVTVALRILALGWATLCLFYAVILSQLLYPAH